MRIAMISMHTSPIEQPGSGDAGGMNVYVLNSARQLARRGIEVDVYTRATRPSQGEIIEVEPHLRVINIVAGPYEGLDKEDLPTQLAAFAGGMVQFAKWQGKKYDLIHSHYWLSGQVGWLLRDLWGIPLIHRGACLKKIPYLHNTGQLGTTRLDKIGNIDNFIQIRHLKVGGCVPVRDLFKKGASLLG